MAVYDFDALANDYVSKDGKEGKDGGKSRLAVNNEKWHIVDLEPISEISHARPSGIGMRNDDDFVSAIDEFLQQ